MQAHTLDPKSAAKDYRIHPYCESACALFYEASQTVEKAIACKKTDLPIASLPSLCSVHCMQYAFVLQAKNAVDEAIGVCEPLLSDVLAHEA